VLTLVICCFLPREASAVAIYDWVPTPAAGQGGTGFISLIPLGAGATDSDFTSSTVIDLQFTFDNGAPTITLSDLIIVDPLETPNAIAGVLFSPWAFFRNPATFTDARLVFAAGSADYKTFLDPNAPPIPFPQETHSGSWLLRGASGPTAPTADPNGPYSALPGVPITLDGTGSSDPDGDIIEYLWQIASLGAPVFGPTPTVTFPFAGTFDINLVVTDSTGLQDQASTFATVVPEPSTMLLLGSGLAGLGFFRWRRKREAK